MPQRHGNSFSSAGVREYACSGLYLLAALVSGQPIHVNPAFSVHGAFMTGLEPYLTISLDCFDELVRETVQVFIDSWWTGS